MKIVKVSTSGNANLARLLLRQTPGGRGIWGDCQFIVDQPVDCCDWWVVCHRTGLKHPEATLCDPNHLVFISMEPAEPALPGKFLHQFSKAVLCDRGIIHSDITYLNGLTWWVGINVRHENGHLFSPHVRFDYDNFTAMGCQEKKERRISVICSNNSSMPGHRKRLSFLERLKAHPVGANVDVFGGGFQPIPDKWDAIAPYKYTIVLENSMVPDYWSEKLADSFLGFTLPIYYGCPNVFDYFSPKALRLINIDDFGQSVAVLEEILNSDPYDEHAEAILQARNQVLNQYNIFQLMADICDKPAGRLVKCKMKPLSDFERSWPRRMAKKIIYRLRGIQ